jgi:hypothetical protein
MPGPAALATEVLLLLVVVVAAVAVAAIVVTVVVTLATVWVLALVAVQMGPVRETMYAKVPSRLTVSMRLLLRSNHMASQCVFLGFTKDGTHLCTSSNH